MSHVIIGQVLLKWIMRIQILCTKYATGMISLMSIIFHRTNGLVKVNFTSFDSLKYNKEMSLIMVIGALWG